MLLGKIAKIGFLRRSFHCVKLWMVCVAALAERAGGTVVIHLNTIDVAIGEPNEPKLIGQAGQVIDQVY
ncbi:hypothetical protein C6382_08195 [Pseudomonas sp. BBP2017]|nr:hypothetical protein C6382_08195 [Pseudomonas sp. BBP2017]